ncbi:4-hydroxy-tetrahydrodipicolinate synthase [Pseudooctadecabacter sp.]|uniref:4-hydroxy-tetrahydrodipicolinate synthase n=1 Tax=Pseudooctadecabacter sp. TaxID=1966338 RepID=UPI0025EB046E|nr:4-hydroxy-tetrahydrodipicolinate synthase [Pseudooctadecabacter sp.]
MLKGSLPALVTPFKDGQLDLDTLKKLVEWHIEQGSHGLVPVGTTGESPTLTHAEHDLVVETVVKAAAGRIPVVAGAGSNNTAETVRLVKAAKVAGADAALVVTPYYNKPTQRGLIAHFTAAADCGLPIVIYNIPGRSVVDMTPETMGVLAQHENILGVKDATGDLARVPNQRLSCGTDFVQLSGEDPTAIGFNAQGGVGCISVTANVAPALCAQMQEATLAGDYPAALALNDRLMPLHKAIFTEPGLVGAKYGMSLLGLCSDEVRSPLTGLEDSTKTKMRDAMVHAGLLN